MQDKHIMASGATFLIHTLIPFSVGGACLSSESRLGDMRGAVWTLHIYP